MRLVRLFTRSFVVLVLAFAGFTFGMSSPATAAPPPGCVHGEVVPGGEFGIVRVLNNCGTTQRVKVLIAFGPDSECFVISPADNRTFEIDDHVGPGHPRFDGLTAC